MIWCHLSLILILQPKATRKKQSGNGASQFFFKFVLVGANASADRFQYPSRAGVGWVSFARLPCLYVACTLPACFSKLFGQLSCCLGYGLFVWQVCTAFILSGLLVNLSASFQAIRPAFKPFGLVYKPDYFALYNWKWANQLIKLDDWSINW